MAISSDYSKPITVNGYVCRNCDDVAKAKKFEDPSGKAVELSVRASENAVTFGGALAGRNVEAAAPAHPARQALDRYA